MRVLRLCSVYEVPADTLTGRGVSFDPVGGMQSHAASLTRALDAMGVAQTVLTTRPPGAPTRRHVGARSVVHRVGLPVPWLRQGYGAAAAARLPGLARGVDLVHAHLGEDLAVLPLAVAAQRIAGGARLVVTVHTSVAHTLAVTDARSYVLKHLGGAIERKVSSRADAVIALTPRLAEILRGVGVEHVAVIPSGVEPAAYAPREGDPLPDVKHPRIICVARLHDQKDPLSLVRAVPHLRSEGQVVIVGDGPLRGEVEAEIDRLGVRGRVHLVGAVTRDQVPALLAASDVFVLPSLYEELGTAVIEAMQAGLPVVATRAGGIPSLVTDGLSGLLVRPQSPVELADALDRVLGDPGLAARLAASGRTVAAGYDWSQLAGRVLAVYEDVLRR